MDFLSGADTEILSVLVVGGLLLPWDLEVREVHQNDDRSQLAVKTSSTCIRVSRQGRGRSGSLHVNDVRQLRSILRREVKDMSHFASVALLEHNVLHPCCYRVLVARFALWSKVLPICCCIKLQRRDFP